MYHRFAHLRTTDLKVGQKIKKGDMIGEVGRTGNSPTSHLHYDILKSVTKETASQFKQYTKGLSREQVLEKYEDPHKYMENDIPIYNDHYGYNFLDVINKKTGQLHPGVDLNGVGGGNADEGTPIASTVDGEVVYSFTEGNNKSNSNSGWGNMVVIKETKPEPIKEESKEEINKPKDEPMKNPFITRKLEELENPIKAEQRKLAENTFYTFLYIALPQILIYIGEGITEANISQGWTITAVVLGIIANSLTKYYLHDIKK